MSVTAFNRRRRALAALVAQPEPQEKPLTEYEAAKAKATALGLGFKSNISKKDLLAMIEVKKAEMAAADQWQALKDEATTLGIEMDWTGPEVITTETLAAAIEAKKTELASQE